VRATTTAAKEANCFTVNPGTRSELRARRKSYTRRACCGRFAPIVVRNPRFRVLESNLSSPGMLPEIENLLHLQEADKAIRRLQDENRRTPKRGRAIGTQTGGHQTAIGKKLRPPSRRMKPPAASTTLAIADLRERFPSIAINRLTLNQRAVQALLHEIQFAEKEIAATEDKILEADGECRRPR